MNLYEIDKNIKEVLENGFSFDEETGEIKFETDDLDKLEIAKEEKINNIIGFVKDLDIQSDNYKKISDEYKKRADSKKKHSENLKKYLSDFLINNDMTDRTEYKNGITSFRKSESLSIENDVDLENYLKGNEEYQKYLKYKLDFDKTGLKSELKKGAEIPFVKIEEKSNLQIK